MKSKLTEVFNLPTEAETENKSAIKPSAPPTDDKQNEAKSNLKKIDDALKAVKDLEEADAELDEIADAAMSSYRDLMDLGMNVEARYAQDILGSASGFLGHAINAKTAKINRKLKTLDLQLKKAKLDLDRGDSGSESLTGSILDRNELLDRILPKRGDD